MNSSRTGVSQDIPQPEHHDLDLNPGLFTYGGQLKMTVRPVLTFTDGRAPISGETVRVMMRMSRFPVPGREEEEMTLIALTRGLETEEEVYSACGDAIRAWKTGISELQTTLDVGLVDLGLTEELTEIKRAANKQGVVEEITKALSKQLEAAHTRLIDDEARERESLKSIFDESEHHFLKGALDVISDRYTGNLRGMRPISDFVLSLLIKESDKETGSYKTAQKMLDRVKERDLQKSSREAQGTTSANGERADAASRDEVIDPTFAGIDKAMATADDHRRYLQSLIAKRASESSK